MRHIDVVEGSVGSRVPLARAPVSTAPNRVTKRWHWLRFHDLRRIAATRMQSAGAGTLRLEPMPIR